MKVEELHALARDRPLRTREIHWPNDYYGHADALKRYAGISPKRPLKAVVEHGLTPLVDDVWELDVRSPLPVLLCSGRQRAEELAQRSRPGALVIPIGPLVHYSSKQPALPRSGDCLVAFPAHSTHHVRLEYDALRFARKLASYRSDFSRVRVCLYWRDVLRGMASAYRAEGFECVTAGHIYDRAFLPRLRRILESADTVVTNHFGTYVPYAIALGRPVWVVEQAVRRVASPEALARYTTSPDRWQNAVDDIPSLFPEGTVHVTDEQRARLDPFSGFDEVRGQEALRAILDDAAERYRGTTPLRRQVEHELKRRVARPLLTSWRWRRSAMSS